VQAVVTILSLTFFKKNFLIQLFPPPEQARHLTNKKAG
jgi:hypothetical protein